MSDRDDWDDIETTDGSLGLGIHCKRSKSQFLRLSNF